MGAGQACAVAAKLTQAAAPARHPVGWADRVV